VSPPLSSGLEIVRKTLGQHEIATRTENSHRPERWRAGMFANFVVRIAPPASRERIAAGLDRRRNRLNF
jgi:hypothetical protein